MKNKEQIEQIDNILKEELDEHYTSAKHRWQIACRIVKTFRSKINQDRR